MAVGAAGELDRLVPELYGELKKLALHALAPGERGATLQPTALVAEAYLRLRRVHRLDVSNRKQFLALAGKVMRQVLVDYARGRGRAKRGGGAATVLLGDQLPERPQPLLDLLELEAALERLGRVDPRQVEIVELRYLAGLSVEETAETLGLSPTTVKREAAMARAYLLARLDPGTTP
jgi:RNA polymerase sigma factor (TIGR02999 family)